MNNQPNIIAHKEQTITIQQSLNLSGEVALSGAKNAVLVIIASLILTKGKSILHNVPNSHDVLHMITLMRELGAHIMFDATANILEIDTTSLSGYTISPELMKKMRASVLVMGPLLARFSHANVALPGGCLLGSRPINFHVQNFEKMGVLFTHHEDFLSGATQSLNAQKLVLEYPSVGATENLMMAATLAQGTTHIVNAALEPEVLDLIHVLTKMGSIITIHPPATISITGVTKLNPIIHHVMHDRLEAGTLLLAAAITGGEVYLPQASPNLLDVFLLKMREMGHTIETTNKQGIYLRATEQPRAVSFTTAPYPGFPTDLQAPMMAAQALALGKSEIHETVFENRFLHIRELQKMGAQITYEGSRASIAGVESLYGTSVIATDIRASCALVLAGLAAQGTTCVTGIKHWQRGYDALENKLAKMGAAITIN